MDKHLLNSSTNEYKNNTYTKNTKKNKKFNFCEKKENTIKSLNNVEFFLRDFHRFKNYIKLFKFMK